MAMAWVPHALAVAGMVLARRMYVQCIKRLLLAGIEAAVESACGFVTLLGFCRALCAHFLRQVQTFGGGQRAQVCARSLALSPWCRRGGFDILLHAASCWGCSCKMVFRRSLRSAWNWAKSAG